MANDSPRTLTQKQSGTVSKESQFIVPDIDFYSGPIPIPFPFFVLVALLIMRLLSSQGFFGGCPSPRESRNNWQSGISHACHRQFEASNPSSPFYWKIHLFFYGQDFVVLILGTFIASTQVRTSICLRKCEKCGN